MDAIGLTEYLLKDIREKKDALTHSLAVGAVDNIETYRLVHCLKLLKKHSHQQKKTKTQ